MKRSNNSDDDTNKDQLDAGDQFVGKAPKKKICSTPQPDCQATTESYCGDGVRL